ncbi:MAG: hypothetical protein ACK5HL_00265 [Bacilli bacterium]
MVAILGCVVIYVLFSSPTQKLVTVFNKTLDNYYAKVKINEAVQGKITSKGNVSFKTTLNKDLLGGFVDKQSLNAIENAINSSSFKYYVTSDTSTEKAKIILDMFLNKKSFMNVSFYKDGNMNYIQSEELLNSIIKFDQSDLKMNNQSYTFTDKQIDILSNGIRKILTTIASNADVEISKEEIEISGNKFESEIYTLDLGKNDAKPAIELLGSVKTEIKNDKEFLDLVNKLYNSNLIENIDNMKSSLEKSKYFPTIKLYSKDDILIKIEMLDKNSTIVFEIIVLENKVYANASIKTDGETINLLKFK